MPLLGTFIYAGAFCLAAGAANCFAHGLPTTPDFVSYTPITASVTRPNLTTRGATGVNMNHAGGDQNGEVFAPAFHSIIR